MTVEDSVRDIVNNNDLTYLDRIIFIKEIVNGKGMKTIHKYPFPDELDADEPFEIKMPAGAVVLSIQMQKNIPTIWAEVSPDADMVSRKFLAAFTGRPLPKGNLIYIATIQTPMPVVHIYEVR